MEREQASASTVKSNSSASSKMRRHSASLAAPPSGFDGEHMKTAAVRASVSRGRAAKSGKKCVSRVALT
jgi:hypothetical protein